MSNPIRDALNSTFSASCPAKREIEIADILNCTGSSRSFLARALSRISLSVKTGTLMTDARIAKILSANGAGTIGRIAAIFKNNAEIINFNFKNKTISHNITLKGSGKDLQNATDLLKLFNKVIKESTTYFDPTIKITIPDAQQQVQ